MYCIKKIKDDLFWVGGTDRRLTLFENAFPIPRGVSYNAYVLKDEKTVLFDTVDNAIGRTRWSFRADGTHHRRTNRSYHLEHVRNHRVRKSRMR